MAFVDYGAMVCVNGVFINKNKDFMETESETGYKPMVPNLDSGELEELGGHAVVGDASMCVVFYKSEVIIIKDNKIINTVWYSPFLEQTVFLPECESKITVSRLDKTLYDKKAYYGYEEERSWEEWCSLHPYRSTKRSLKNKSYRKFLHWRKRMSRCKWLDYSNRYIARWEHNSNHYEVIFGYGIDPDEEVFEEIKERYGFEEPEIKIIREWFER